MNIQIFTKSKCFDSKKAERWFKERRIAFQKIDTPAKGLSRGELRSVITAVGGIDKVIDVKAAGAEVLKYLAYEDDKFEKLIEDPRLIATPIVRNGRFATVGYEPAVWEKWT